MVLACCLTRTMVALWYSLNRLRGSEFQYHSIYQSTLVLPIDIFTTVPQYFFYQGFLLYSTWLCYWHSTNMILQGSPFDLYAKLQKKWSSVIIAVSSCGKMRVSHKDSFFHKFISNINEVQIVGPHLQSIPRFKNKNTFREHGFPPVFQVHCFTVGQQGWRQGHVFLILVSKMMNFMLQKYFLFQLLAEISVCNLQKKFIRSTLKDFQRFIIGIQDEVGLDRLWWRILWCRHPWHISFFRQTGTVFN